MPATTPASVYVHFPWCLAKCPYCDFVSYAAPRESIDHVGYADAVLRELAVRAAELPRMRIGSVFFGGGTPSLWSPRELGRVLAGILRAFDRAPDLEVTVECNPTSLDGDGARALLREGVNRLSIGTQSLRADQLLHLGRLHDPDGARRALDAALGSGMPRVSTDLIFGLPEQTPDDARAQAEALADLGLSHLSCYQLTIEPGTRFGELAKRGRLPRADDADVVAAFLAIDQALTARGFGHYEISNYARPGEEARHNLGYWRGAEYVGLGCAAFGFVVPGGDRAAGSGVRYRNAVEPRAYLASTASAASLHAAESVEPLAADALLRERIMLGLRLATPFDLGAAARELGVPGWTEARTRTAEALASRGRLVRTGECIAMTPESWLWTDDTAARLF